MASPTSSGMQLISQQQLGAMMSKDKSLSKNLFLQNGQVKKDGQGKLNWADNKRQQSAARRAPSAHTSPLRKALDKHRNNAPTQRPLQQGVPSPTSRVAPSSSSKAPTSPPTPRVLQPQVQGARVQKNPAGVFMSDPRKKKPFLAVPQRQTLASISNNVQQKPVAAQPLSKEEINRRLDHEDAKWAAENEPSMPEKQVVGSNSREFGCDLASVSQQLTRDESVDVQMVEDNQYDDLFEEKPAAIDTPIINDMADDDGLGAAIDEALKYPTAGLKPAAAVVVPAAKPTTPADPLELVGAPKLTKDWRRNVEETGQWLAEFTRRKQLERRGIFTAAVSISAVPVAQLFAAEPEATESYSDEENYTSDEESDESEEE